MIAIGLGIIVFTERRGKRIGWTIFSAVCIAASVVLLFIINSFWGTLVGWIVLGMCPKKKKNLEEKPNLSRPTTCGSTPLWTSITPPLASFLCLLELAFHLILFWCQGCLPPSPFHVLRIGVPHSVVLPVPPLMSLEFVPSSLPSPPSPLPPDFILVSETHLTKPALPDPPFSCIHVFFFRY